ncbi:MAG: DUF3313 family protein [Caulobacter sp.]|nr:DUF3313 family protein [Caulobacter sp.]
MSRRFFVSLAALALVAASQPVAFAAEKAPTSWDNMVQVKSKKLDVVFLTPGADFRAYSKVMFDPTEVAFEKNFQRNYNTDTVDLSRRLTTNDLQRISGEVKDGFEKVFREAYQKAGYQIVDAPGPDVLRLRTAVADLYVSGPDTMSPDRVITFTADAGRATLVLEARDSVTGALLGRAVDKRTVADMGPYLRNRASNQQDFGNLFESWAGTSVTGLEELKAQSPIDPSGLKAK